MSDSLRDDLNPCQDPAGRLVDSAGVPLSADPAPRIVSPYGDPIPNILPFCGISLLAGAPNVGKTALLAGILKAFRDGTPIFGHQPNPVADIGFINADRGWERGAGFWLGRVGFPEIKQYTMADDPNFNPKRLRKRHERVDILCSFIDSLKLPAYSLINTDPIALFMGGNLLNYDDCAVACHEIRKYLLERKYTMIATAHSSKIKADKRERYMRLQDQILGSTAIFGFTDTQMYLASPQETGKPYFTFLWHPHAAPVEVFYLQQTAIGLFENYDPTTDKGNQARVLSLFPEDGSVLALSDIVDLAQRFPLSKATVKRMLEGLLEDEKIIRVLHGQYCRAMVH